MIEKDGHKYIRKNILSQLGPTHYYICENCKLTYFDSDYVNDIMKNLSCNEQIIKNIIE